MPKGFNRWCYPQKKKSSLVSHLLITSNLKRKKYKENKPLRHCSGSETPSLVQYTNLNKILQAIPDIKGNVYFFSSKVTL